MSDRDLIKEPVAFIDQRTSAAPLLRKTLRYLFPDHWSFLLGEVALYSFVFLVLTGTYLALFFHPSTAQTVYHGAYRPLDGRTMSDAYKSVIDISLYYKAGLMIRQTHHWAADVFMAAILTHLMRVFFTGAFRKPRELTWMVGVTLLIISLLEGYLGYSMIDDLLSGMGLAIGYGVGLSIPIIGGPVIQGLFGAPFPGSPNFWPRMFIAHVFIFPMVIATLIGIHLLLVAGRHHTQFKESKRTTNKRLVGAPMFPAQMPRSLALFFFTGGVLFLLGGLVQINPIWLWGPFHTYLGENGAQPDWYLGWLIGALRLMPSFDWVVGHYTVIPNPFWGGVLFPGIVFTILLAMPFLERRLTRDYTVHNLAERPREAPRRTAFGMAFLTFVFVVFAFGAADRLYVLFDITYGDQLWIFRIALVVLPVFAYFVTRTLCRNLRAADVIEEVREQAEEEAAARARYRLAHRTRTAGD